MGGGITVCQSEGTHQIVTSFSPPVVGCWLKKAHKGGWGGGHRHPRSPSPWLHPCLCLCLCSCRKENQSIEVDESLSGPCFEPSRSASSGSMVEAEGSVARRHKKGLRMTFKISLKHPIFSRLWCTCEKWH